MKITEGRRRAGGAADRPEVAQAELAGRLDQDLPRPAVPDKPEATVDPGGADQVGAAGRRFRGDARTDG